MSILAAVDTTPESKLVFEVAAALAEAIDAKVRLVHVVAPTAPFAPLPGMIPATGVDPVPGLVSRAEDRLAGMEQELPTGRNGGSAVEVGPVADTLLRVAAEEGAELLVIGAHAHGAIARALGTTAAHIVNRARGAVLVVRPTAGGSVAGAPLRILAAVDSSDTAGAVVARATELARASGARVRLLRVEPYLDQPQAPLGRSAGGADTELRRLEADIPAECRDGTSILRGDSAAQICAFAKEYGADVVVIGAHAYGWSARLLGTTAAAVVDGIDRPLLVVREAARVHSRGDLRAEHARLDKIYQSLVDSFGGGEWTDVQAEWAVFEPAVRAHMAFEERVFFRRFCVAYPAFPVDAEVLELQHGELRKELDRFAVAIELHSVVQRDVAELIAMIRRHAVHEEEVFCRWLDHTPPSSRAGAPGGHVRQ